jgi:hypothetical protein
LRVAASSVPLANRRKLRPLLWPVSRNVIVACAGLCGVALAPHLAFAGVGPATTASAHARTISIDDETLIAMNIGRFRIADDVTAAPLNGSLCVDAQQAFNALDFPILVDSKSERLNGWYIREAKTVDLNLRTGTGQIGGARVSIDPASIGTLSTGACITTDALAKLLGLAFEYSPNSTLLSVSSQEQLPLLERLQRQARTKIGSLSLIRDDAAPRPQSLPYRAFVPPNTDLTVTFGKTRGPTAPKGLSVGWASISVGELAYMTAEAQLGGSEAGLNGEVSRFRLYRTERDGGVFGYTKLTEFGVGDISGIGSALGSTGGLGAGITASSFPLNRPTSFDKTDFVGDLPSGWDVELYRNGQLLEARNDGTTGGYAFRDVPVLFGDNEFQVVQYGPQGQRRVINRRVNATNFLAPKGEAYYRAAIYRPEVLFGRKRAGSGVRMDIRGAFGIADNLSVGVGLDSYVNFGRRLSIASLSAQTSLYGVALNSEISATSDSRLAAQIEFQSLGNGYGLRGRVLVAQKGYFTERVSNGQLARLELGADRNVSFSSRTSGTLSGRFQFDQFHNGENSFTAKQRMTLSHGNAWLAQSLSWNHSSTGERRDQIDGDFAYSMRRGFQSLRASVDYTLYPTPKINRLSAIVERSFGVTEHAWRWRAETNWLAKENSFNYVVALGRNFNAVNLDLIAETDGRDNHKVGLSLSFALGRRNNGWGVTSRSLAPNGTVRARLFEDMDDDGKFSAGDVPVVGASVMANSGRNISRTDPAGYAVIEAIAPNEGAQINVITDDIDNPNLFARTTITKPREGTVSEIAIPLTQMGAIEGSVELVSGLEGQANAIGGITLVLLDQQQREIARTTSAYDGFYSFELVPVGTYTVALAPDSSLASRLRPLQPVEVTTTRAEPGSHDRSMTLIERNPTRTKMALRGLL